MGLRDAVTGAAKMPGVAWSFSRLGYRRRARAFSEEGLSASLRRKTFVVTGANSGIGFEVAKGLLDREAHVWLLCRDPQRGQQACDALAREGRGRVSLETVDMTDLGALSELLARWKPGPIAGLVHNAGALFHERTETPGGIDQTFALHVVGPELLTRGLLASLTTGQGRVVYVASGGMYAEALSVPSLERPPDPFDGTRAYARAKRAQVVLAQMWAEHHPAVGFFAMHPGWADTPGVVSALPGFHRLTRRILRTPKEGADTVVWLMALERPAFSNGSFLFDRAVVARHMLASTRVGRPHWEALWQRVERLVQPWL